MSVLISNDAELDTLLDAQEVEHICEVVLAAEGVERSSSAISSWPRRSLPVRPPALAIALPTSAA